MLYIIKTFNLADLRDNEFEINEDSMEDSSEDSDSEAEFDEESIIKYYFNHGHTCI